MAKATTTPTTDAPMTRKACIAYLQNHGAYTGCSRYSVEQLRQAVERTKARGQGPSEADVAEALTKLQAEMESPEFAQALADGDALLDAMAVPAGVVIDVIDADCAECPDPDGEERNPECEGLQASTDAVERAALAKAEWAALKAWRVSDLVGRAPRPCTPNLDALNAEHAANAQGTRAATGAKARTPRAASTTSAPRAGHSARYTEALAVKKANPKRGAGIKVTDEQLAEYVAKVRTEHPTAVAAQELEFAYYVEKLAVTRARWSAAWAAAEPTSAR
jgi:hypothetical protein